MWTRFRHGLILALVLAGAVPMIAQQLMLIGVTGGGASAAIIPDMVQVTSGSNTLTNALGTTVNGCPNNTYCFFLPEATATAQTIIGCVTYSESPSVTISVTDDGSNTYVIADTADDTSNTKKVAMFYALNVASGTRQIKVLSSGASTQVAAAAWVFYNVATTSALDVHAVNFSASGSSTMSSGSITPAQTGELLVECGRRTQTKAVSSFTAGSQSNITWKLLTADNEDGLVGQWGVYSSTSAINPQLTMGSNSGYAAVGAGFKTATAGSARATGMHIIGVHQYNFLPAELASSPVTIQVPTLGNLVAISSGFGGSSTCTVTSATDGPGNTYAMATTSYGDSSTGRSTVAYAGNATASLTNTIAVTFSSPDANCDATILVYDIIGAATSPFTQAVGTIHTTGGGASAYTFFNGTPLAPAADSGISIWNAPQSTDTVQSTSAPCTTVDQVYFGGETISGGSTHPPGENNGWGHCAFSDGLQQTYTIGYASTVATNKAYNVAFFKSSTAALSPMALDNFDRANATLTTAPADALWVTEFGRNPFKIVTNTAEPNAQNTDGGTVYKAVTFTADQWAQCTLNAIGGTGSGNGIGVLLRAATGARTEYRVVVNATAGTNTFIDRFNAGSNSGILASANKGSAWAANDVVYALITGTGASTRVRVRNGSGGSDIIDFTDASCGANCINSGFPGLALSSTMSAGTACKDWSASNN